MLSKLITPSYKINNTWLLVRKVSPKIKNTRKSSDMIPPTQYDVPFPDRLRLGNAVRDNWETIPLFFVTACSVAMAIFSLMWAAKNKVDVVFTTHSRRNISHTMDLRCPTAHKLVLINQKYEPWPEMQDVLDKMLIAEKRALARAQACALVT